jgi:nitroreductase
MNIPEVIKIRRSRRTFNAEALKAQDKQLLLNYFKENQNALGYEPVNFNIIEKRPDEKKMKLEYGIIRGHHTYILGKSKATITSRVNYGYLMEKIVLKATEMNLATCWVGYFDKNYFNEIDIENGYEIPSIVVVGYSEEQHSFVDKVARLVVSASKRKDWDKLFFNYESKTPINSDFSSHYSDSLEMVRKAPSSGNTQPWRIYFDSIENEFHFFKKSINKWYEARGLHDIDMGIALCHFELTSHYNGLSGKWIKKSDIELSNDLQYIMTWKCL